MPLSWNEIKTRALGFSRQWADAHYEDGQAKPFLIDFFEVFGITNKRIASFEHNVKKYGGKDGYVDLFWPGILLVEMKSRGKDLGRAYTQALDYFPGIVERDLPQYVLVCDFARFRLYTLSPLAGRGQGEGSGGEGQPYVEFLLADLYKNVKLFGFIAGYQTQIIKPQDPINIKAAERMGRLHDALNAVGYAGRPLEVYLVRLLFCLFAEDTSIFQKRLFQDYIETKTKQDGSDLAHHISSLFYLLNTPEDKRLTNLDEELAAFPYINGKLFEEQLPPAAFDSQMREALLDLCALDWSVISPAIFGSLFQSIMKVEDRRNLGAHYTSEENILKLIKPLFLDALWAEFEKIKTSKNRLFEFHKKLRSLNFLDPACGCGNFLVITYRELRLLELEVLRASRASGQQVLDVQQLINVDVDQFYGIEIEEFPAQIAQVALWLTDHQMNMRVSEEFGSYYARIPLKATPHIVCGNALRLNWAELLPPEQCSYVLGNPPFIGYTQRSVQQKADLELVCHDIHGAGVLDFVAAWYVKAARYINTHLPASRAREFGSPHPTQWGEGQGVRGARRDPATEEKLKAYARELRASATDAEQKLWQLLRDRRFFDFKFRRQHPVAGYILDFYCAEAKLAIELDGGQHSEQTGYDTQRESLLSQQGIKTMRFWNNEFLQNPEGVLEALAMTLGVLPSSPPLLPAGQGEGGKTPSPHLWGEGWGEGRSCIRCAFVSTNSITQGEQVGVLWGWMLGQGVKIHFAHRTFSWNNEARGKAAVHCVIIGFYRPSPDLSATLSPQVGRGQGEGDIDKIIYEYENIKGEPHAIKASNINPYLVDAPNIVLQKRNTPICNVPEVIKGSQPTDGGHLLLTAEEKEALIQAEPAAGAWIRPFLGAEEFINAIPRYCLWLVDCPPQELKKMPLVLARLEAVKAIRLASSKASTKEWAAQPGLFTENRQPVTSYLLVPRHSSERREIIPIGFFQPTVVVGDANLCVPNAGLYHFGVMTSRMHMAWVKAVCGRLESRYRYTNSIVYNNFPWPNFPSPQPSPRKQGEGANLLSPHAVGRGAGGEGKMNNGEGCVTAIEAAAQAVLDARATHPEATLADLYDPLTMPANLLKAHQMLDKAVDAAYGYKGAATDAARVAFLFERYQQITSLLPTDKPKRRRSRK